MVFDPLTYESEISAWLNKSHPGKFKSMQVDLDGVKGLKITTPGRAGYVFIHQPSSDGSSYLLSCFHETDEDRDSTVWEFRKLKEMDNPIKSWAFPKTWTQPLAIDEAREKIRLAKLHDGLLNRATEISVTIAPYNPISQDLTEVALKELEEDLKAIDRQKVLFNFPSDENGRLKLGSIVLLREYESVKPPGKDRSACLMAIGPERRSDAQNIHIAVTSLIVPNQSHDWRGYEWLWQQNKDAANWYRWGLDPKISGDNSAEAATAAASLALLDEGKIVEAFQLYGIKFEDDVVKLIGGERIRSIGSAGNPTEEWTEVTVNALRESAPWLFPKAVKDAIQAHANWASKKKGRNKHFVPDLRLIILPGQFRQQKACLSFTAEPDGSDMQITTSLTGSNARLAETNWKRPICVDFERFGITK